MSTTWLKGHGTRNDFVVLPDLDGSLFADLDTELVRALCDRQAGLGADGLLRVVRTKAVPDLAELADEAEWCMDYRNADGSLAEMCGNGIRVFVRYLLDTELVDAGAPVPVATRGGVRSVVLEQDGQLTVAMGRATVVRTDVPLTVQTATGPRPATGLLLPNPHAVVLVDDLDDAGTLLQAPPVEPADAFPEGVNVEFVVRRGARHVAMRVHERGSGETLSCGTGACAAAVAVMRLDAAAAGTSYIVDTRGGRLVVSEDDSGEVRLTGPAALTLRGTVELPSRGIST